MHNFNEAIIMLINQGAGQYPALDGFFIVLTSYSVPIVVAGVMLHFLMQPLRSTSSLRDRLQHIRATMNIALSLAVTSIVVWAIKVLVAQPRPFVALAGVRPLVSAAPFESFPSMHAALTMALAIAVLPYHKHLGHLLIAFSLVVALSRLFVGVHYPFDVGAGLLIGYFVSKIIYWIFKK